MCAPPLLRNSPGIAFEMVPVLAWLLMSLSHPFHQRSSSAFTFYTSLLEAVSGVMSSALFAPASSVSSFSTLEIFPDTNLMWWSWLLCIRGCLVGHFPQLWHVWDCTSTGVFKDGSLDVKHWDTCQSMVMMACDPTDSSWGSPPEWVWVLPLPSSRCRWRAYTFDRRHCSHGWWQHTAWQQGRPHPPQGRPHPNWCLATIRVDLAVFWNKTLGLWICC